MRFQQMPPVQTPSTLPGGMPADPYARQMQMVQQMSQQSNMNMEWSKKCLEETNWDYNRAIYVFTELQKQNKIPQEAFLK